MVPLPWRKEEYLNKKPMGQSSDTTVSAVVDALVNMKRSITENGVDTDFGTTDWYDITTQEKDTVETKKSLNIIEKGKYFYGSD